jgi:hypothetical protein
MKKILFPSLLLLLSYNCISQKQIEFLKNKIYIVKTDYPFLDSSLKEVMTRDWDLSEIGGYIDRKELKKMSKDETYSFLDPTTYNWWNNSNMNGARFASGLYFYYGKRKYSAFENVVNVEHFGDYAGDNFDSSVYKIELMIRTAKNSIKYFNKMDSIKKIYNFSLLKKQKTLLVNMKYMNNRKKQDDNFSKSAFSNYPYKVKFVTSAQITEFIKSKDKDYVLAVPIVNDAARGVNFYDIQTGFFIGYLERKGYAGPALIREKEIDQLVENINGVE